MKIRSSVWITLFMLAILAAAVYIVRHGGDLFAMY